MLVSLFVGQRVVSAIAGGESPAAASTTTEAPTTSTVPLRSPADCTAGAETAPTTYARPDDWYRTLLDTSFALPDDYHPPDLVSAAGAHFSAEFQVRAIVVEDLNRLRNGIIEAGLPEVALAAAYRTAEQQQAHFSERVAEVGADEAVLSAAMPGHSEHQLGTAVDFRPIDATSVDDSFAATPTGAWLAEHAWEFGFVMSHPPGLTEVTCRRGEPWHFRYLGPELAARVHASGLSLREYLWHWEETGTEPGVAPASAASLPLPTVPVSARN